MDSSKSVLKIGSLLISQPELGDPRFETSVSLLCDHDEHGSFALILNKPTHLFIDILDFSISDTFSKKSQYPIWMGGPVQLDQCFFIFRFKESLPDANNIIEDLYFSNSQNVLYHLFKNNPLDNSSIRFFLGYAGWSYYQLECEISYGWWLISQADATSAFHPSPNDQWLDSLKSIDPSLYQKGLNFIKSTSS